MTLHKERQKARLASGLLIVSIALMMLQEFGLNKTLFLNAHSSYPITAIDDRSNGGASISSHQFTPEGDIILDCEIVASSYQWPYCEITISFVEDTVEGDIAGIDLSSYQQASLWVRYAEPNTLGTRFQLRNFNPAYSSYDDEGSLKYNGVEYYQAQTPYPAVVALKSLQVPTWWLVERGIPLNLISPEFKNIHTLEIATGNGIKPGKYRMIIEGVEFRGKYISDEHLYLALLVLWGVVILWYVLHKAYYIQRQLKHATHRQRELEALNRLLNVRSQELEEQLDRDPLTGVLNREGIAKIFDDTQHSQEALHLSIMFIDIDHFKHINDSHGHNVGDAVLVEFAQVLSRNTRDMDILARWGGEEFILACPNTGLSFASQLAEKLRKALEDNQWPEDLTVTASFGVAELQDESPTDFIHRADQALYAAKAQGRNRVEISR